VQAGIAAVPVRQTGVVASDEIGQHSARCLAKFITGMDGACCRMVNTPIAFNMGILDVEASGVPNIALESGAVFAKVVPLTSQSGPILTKFASETGSERGHAAQVVGEIVRLTPGAVRIAGGVSNEACAHDGFSSLFSSVPE
jgi:hypothetical protein